MKKRIIETAPQRPRGQTDSWLNLEDLAEVEITSEDMDHPIESALLPERGPGWRAANPGKQIMRVVFSAPQTLRRIQLDFVEAVAERTQEYALRWSSDRGQSFVEIVRQQWNFNPAGSTHESEDHLINLQGVTQLELVVIPDISGGNARASLQKLRVA